MQSPIGSMFLSPISICTIYTKVAAEAGIATTQSADSNRKKILIRVARFITSAITIPIFTPSTVFYNTFCFTIKGSLAILTYMLDTQLFGNTHDQYLNEMNLHVAYAIRELVNDFFIGFISLGYTFDPDLIVMIDSFITNTIEYLCVDPLLAAAADLPP